MMKIEIETWRGSLGEWIFFASTLLPASVSLSARVHLNIVVVIVIV